MNYKESAHLVIKGELPSGSISWQSPSNIALVKYWGKHGDQLPNNPSLSFTLTKANTQAALSYGPRQIAAGGVSMSFQFDDQDNHPFGTRIEKYLHRLVPIFPFIEQLHFEIRSRNSFPHSSGIASSASSLSALALCLCSLEHQLFSTLEKDQDFRKKASYVARLGSGSACRSIYANAALWGKTGLIEGSSDDFAVAIGGQVHPTMLDFRDAILIVSTQPKSTSSSSGHLMMDTHLFATSRYDSARKNLHLMLDAMRTADLERLGQLCEHEALTLHALMMSSQPYVLLLHPNTIKIIQLIQEFRKATQTPVFFTIDAGPNIHLLYPSRTAAEVENFINGVLVEYCEDGAWISDEIGPGPVQF